MKAEWARAHRFTAVAEALNTSTDQIMAAMESKDGVWTVLFTPDDDPEGVWHVILRPDEDGILREMERTEQVGFMEKVRASIEQQLPE